MKNIKFRYYDLTDKKMIYSESHVTLESFFAFYETAEQFGKGAALMQYTGLMDKNGREIFESDIVRNILGYKKVVSELTAKGCFPFIQWPEYKCWPSDECEVIGNIYETVEKGQS